jgi:CHAT domain-containing protein
LVAIENPNQDLPFTEVEVTALRTHFKEDTVYRHQAARKNQIDFQDLHCLHWAGHGYFDLDKPDNSGLVLADAFLSTPTDPARHRLTPRGNYLDMTKCLTLPDIFTLPLDHCRLVTLSACETGWSDPKSSTDEYIGLPSAFLYAGATNVVNSLWQVNDLATAWLMIKFYQNYRQDSTSVAKALNEAQKWLRGLTKRALREWLEESPITLTLNQRAELEDNLSRCGEDEKPYQGVYYWGGFCAVGR